MKAVKLSQIVVITIIMGLLACKKDTCLNISQSQLDQNYIDSINEFPEFDLKTRKIIQRGDPNCTFLKSKNLI